VSVPVAALSTGQNFRKGVTVRRAPYFRDV
jgi:hypothetical protein